VQVPQAAAYAPQATAAFAPQAAYAHPQPTPGSPRSHQAYASAVAAQAYQGAFEAATEQQSLLAQYNEAAAAQVKAQQAQSYAAQQQAAYAQAYGAYQNKLQQQQQQQVSHVSFPTQQPQPVPYGGGFPGGAYGNVGYGPGLAAYPGSASAATYAGPCAGGFPGQQYPGPQGRPMHRSKHRKPACC